MWSLESQDSSVELVKKVMDFLVGYEVACGKEFPNTSWSTTNLVKGYSIKNPRDLYYDWVDKYPDFFKWVSILANRRVNLRNIYHSVGRITQAIREGTFDKAIEVIQEELEYYNKFPEYHSEAEKNRHEMFLVELDMLTKFKQK